MENDRILAVILSIIALLFGLVAVTAPAMVFDFLVIAIGIILLIVGILTAGVGLSAESGLPKMALFGSGLISVFFGLLAIITPYVATVAIGYLVAFWLVINGLLSIAYAISISWEKKRFLTGLGGVISLILGLYLFVNPSSGTALLVLIVGVFFIIFGLLSLLMSLFFWRK